MVKQYTNIRLTQETKQKLKERKLIPAESYESVISRLLDQAEK